MNNRKKIRIALAIITAFVSAASAWCAPPQGDPLEGFPQSGMLAAAGQLPPGNLNLPLPLGLAPGVQPPIAGSISGGAKGWTVSVSNNTGRTLQIQIEAIEYLQGPRRGGSRPFSFRLKPFQSDSDTITAGSNTIGYVLNLTGWRVVDTK